MLHDVFDHPAWHGAGVIALKTLIVYAVLVIGLRLLGKRELGQMSVYDLVLIVILGNAVQNAMINNDNTLGGGVVAAMVLLLANRALNVVMVRSPRVERALEGEPVLIVSDGVVLQGPMRRQGITRDQDPRKRILVLRMSHERWLKSSTSSVRWRSERPPTVFDWLMRH